MDECNDYCQECGCCITCDNYHGYCNCCIINGKLFLGKCPCGAVSSASDPDALSICMWCGEILHVEIPDAD